MQTSSTISVRTSVGRCKSPGIIEFENGEGMGPVDVEAADTNQVGNTLIAARRAPSFARVKFNLEATAQTNVDMGDFGGSLLLFFLIPPRSRYPTCCTTNSRHRSCLFPRLARSDPSCSSPFILPLWRQTSHVVSQRGWRVRVYVHTWACSQPNGKRCDLAASGHRPAAGTAHPCGNC